MADRALVVAAVSPRIIAAIAAVLSVVTRAHLTVNAAGLTISLSLPVALVAALITAIAVLALLIFRQLRGFRSSPYMRSVAGSALCRMAPGRPPDTATA